MHRVSNPLSCSRDHVTPGKPPAVSFFLAHFVVFFHHRTRVGRTRRMNFAASVVVMVTAMFDGDVGDAHGLLSWRSSATRETSRMEPVWSWELILLS